MDSSSLHAVIEDVYNRPLTKWATDKLNSLLKNSPDGETFFRVCHDLRDENRLTKGYTVKETGAPQIVCSLGLV